MRIAGVYSFNKGKETIAKQHRAELEEVLQVIEMVDAERCKTKVSKEKTMRDKVLYSPSALNEAFKEHFSARDWVNHRVIARNIPKSTMYQAIRHVLVQNASWSPIEMWTS